MSASESTAPRREPVPVSMRDLLAACAAAAVISNPPRHPEPRSPRPASSPDHGRPRAA
ncbi:hypothetical protein ACIQGO_02855 [Streptomyces shenzhenensis]|uniref:hypothetical protein n=1 Tax=Streptomyces shenzhenensis TaxID=943815 RepID=UPI0038175ABD